MAEEKAAEQSKKKKVVFPHYITPVRDKPSIKGTRWGDVEITPILVNFKIDSHCYGIGKNPAFFHLDSRGYTLMVGATGSIVVTPDSIPWDDERVRNPYMIHDDDGKLVGAACKKVLIGITPTGDVQITERYVELSLRTLWLQHLRQKVKYAPKAGKTMSMDDFNQLDAKDKKGHTRLIIHEGADDFETVVLLVDLNHDDIQKALDERLKLANDLVKRVETICMRLVASHSPITRVDPIPRGDIQNYQHIEKQYGSDIYLGTYQYPTYRTAHTSKNFDMLALALSVGDGGMLRELMETFGDSVSVDTRKVSEGEAIAVDIVDVECAEDAGPPAIEAGSPPAPPAATIPAPAQPKETPPPTEPQKTPLDLDPDPEFFPEEKEDKTVSAPEKDPGGTSTPEPPETPQAEPETPNEPENSGEPEPVIPEELNPNVVAAKKNQLLKAAHLIPAEDLPGILKQFKVNSLEELEGAAAVACNELVFTKYF